MNNYFAWREPFGDLVLANFKFWSTSVRPLGAVFYAGFHQLFGLNPLPFRIFCFVILYANIALTYWLGYRLSGSIAVAFLASLLHCYHRYFQALYYGTGNCYDVFSYFFYVGAFCLYRELRLLDRLPNVWQTIGFVSLYICGINSKEAAVSLPAVLLFYELLFHKRKRWDWLWRETRTPLLLGVFGLIYILGKLSGSGSLATQDAYRPQFTASAYFHATAVYLNDMICRTDTVLWWHAAVLLTVFVATAAVLRDRLLGLACALIVLGQAPIAFIYPRGLVSYYIPTLGYAIFLSVLLLRYIRPPAWRVAFLVMVTLFLHQWHVRRGAYAVAYAFDEERQIAFIRDEFQRHKEWFTPGQFILIRKDTFQERYASSFLVYLVGHEKSVRIVRLPDDPIPPGAKFTRVLDVVNGRIADVTPKASL